MAESSVPADELSYIAYRVKKGDIYLLRNSLVPSCLVECGFVTGYLDYQNFQKESYKKLVAKYIKQGIENYLLTC